MINPSIIEPYVMHCMVESVNHNLVSKSKGGGMAEEGLKVISPSGGGGGGGFDNVFMSTHIWED